MRAVEDGEIEEGSYLLVESLDRLSRDYAINAIGVLSEIVQLGVTVVTLMDNQEYDLDSLRRDPSRLMLSVLTFTRANQESAVKAERLKAAWEGKRKRAAKGERLTSVSPAWLEADGEGWRVNEERAAVVRRIFALTLEGTGRHSITKTLNEEGVPVFGRGKRWYASYVYKILRNPAVVGTLVPHRLEGERKRKRVPLDPVPGYFPPVVSEETYNRVRALMAKRSPRGRHTTQPMRNVFSGLSYCAACGSTVVRIQKGKPWEYLLCSNAKTGGGCSYITLRYRDVENALVNGATALLGECPVGDSPLDSEIRDLDAQRAGVGDAIARLLTEIQEGRGSPLVSQRRRDLEAHLKAIDARLRELQDEAGGLTPAGIAARVRRLAESLQRDPIDRSEVNRCIKETFKRIEVDVEGGTLTFEWIHGGEHTMQVAWPKERGTRGN